MLNETLETLPGYGASLTPESSINIQTASDTPLKWTSQPMPTTTNIPFPANVQTLLNLVNTLPVGIDRAQGANIIRATLQSMGQATGLTVESILAEAHQNQSELLATIQKNLQKINECQLLIENLEQDIHNKQEQASLLFDLIDLFMMPTQPQVEENA